ncbi:MAG TPA: NUDIX hydrolase [Acidimicrobiales bacterium]|nr:NUDIX hydrolase [Acidimicrobiales bacterium]
MVELNDAGEVRAAGGVVTRVGEGGRLEVLLVHRRAYDDWTLPKGKAEPGETDEGCALREVEEETALRCRLGRELPTVRWLDRFDRPKASRYWLMEVVDPTAAAAAENEIDAVEWLPVDEAVTKLTYPRDAEVLRTVT